MDVILNLLFNGLSLGSVLLLIALGLAVTFGLMGVINMAHGEFIMIGAYAAYLTQTMLTPLLPESMSGLWLLLVLPVAFLVAAAIGWLLERLLIRRLYDRPLDSLLATWGVGLILQQSARTLFGAPNVAVTVPDWLGGGVEVMEGVVFPYNRLFILGLAVFSLLLITLYLYRTRSGRRMRAVMQNRAMAASLGISTRRVDAAGFALGSGVAGLAGCAVALLGPIGPSIGTVYIVDTFMVVVLGGVGRLTGTLLGALSIGLFNTLFEFGTNSTLGKVLVFLLIIAFLQWRPSGFLSVKTRQLDT